MRQRYPQGFRQFVLWLLGLGATTIYKLLEHWGLGWVVHKLEPQAGPIGAWLLNALVEGLPPITWLAAGGILVWLTIRTGRATHPELEVRRAAPLQHPDPPPSLQPPAESKGVVALVPPSGENDDLSVTPGLATVDAVFERSPWPNARIYRDLLAIEFCGTFKELAETLDSLLREFDKFRNSTADPPHVILAAAQERLAALIDRPPTLREPGKASDVDFRTFECYASLVPLFSPGQISRATEHCRGWLLLRGKRESQARETVRNLLFSLRKKQPENRDWLKLHEEVIGSDTENLVQSGLSLILQTGLDSEGLLRLLKTGFETITTHKWDFCLNMWSTVLGTSIDDKKIDEPAQLALLRQVVRYIQDGKPDILSDANQELYMVLAKAIARIHGRQARSQNRHVVPDDTVNVKVTFSGESDNNATLEGKIGNFSSGDGKWKAGAWMTSHNFCPVPEKAENGLGCTVIISSTGAPSLLIVLERGKIFGHDGVKPEDNYNRSHGYRLQFGFTSDIPQDELDKLTRLKRLYPLTQ